MATLETRADINLKPFVKDLKRIQTSGAKTARSFSSTFSKGGATAGRRFSKSFQKSVGKLKKGLKSQMGQMFAGMGLAQMATGALRGIQAQIGEMKTLAAEQEKVENSVASVLQASGKYSDKLFKSLKKDASAIQQVTTVGDEASLKIMQLGMSMGVGADKITKTTKQALGLSQALGVDTKIAMRMAALATKGEYTMLQRYIPTLRTVEDETKKAAIVQKTMADGFKMAKDEAKTAAGQNKQLENTIGDMKEKIGDIINTVQAKISKILEPIFKVMQNNLEAVGAAVAAIGIGIASVLVPAIWSTVAGFVAANAATGGLILAIGALAAGIVMLIKHWKEVISWIGEAAESIGGFLGICEDTDPIKITTKELKKMSEAGKTLGKEINKLDEDIERNGETYRQYKMKLELARDAGEITKNEFNELNKSLDSHTESVEESEEATKSFTQKVWDAYKKIQEYVNIYVLAAKGIKKATKKIFDFIKNALDKVQDWVNAVYDYIKPIIDEYIPALGGALETFKNKILDLFAPIREGIESLENAASTVYKRITDIQQKVEEALGLAAKSRPELSKYGKETAKQKELMNDLTFAVGELDEGLTKSNSRWRAVSEKIMRAKLAGKLTEAQIEKLNKKLFSHLKVTKDDKDAQDENTESSKRQLSTLEKLEKRRKTLISQADDMIKKGKGGTKAYSDAINTIYKLEQKIKNLKDEAEKRKIKLKLDILFGKGGYEDVVEYAKNEIAMPGEPVELPVKFLPEGDIQKTKEKSQKVMQSIYDGMTVKGYEGGLMGNLINFDAMKKQEDKGKESAKHLENFYKGSARAISGAWTGMFEELGKGQESFGKIFKKQMLSMLDTVLNVAIARLWANALSDIKNIQTAGLFAAIFATPIAALIKGKIAKAKKGLKEGGYTGDAGTDEVAGYVHGKEYVSHAGATKRHRPILETLNKVKEPVYLVNKAGELMKSSQKNAPREPSYNLNMQGGGSRGGSQNVNVKTEAAFKHTFGEAKINKDELRLAIEESQRNDLRDA